MASCVLAVIAGASYTILNIDLIPNSTPWIGHADEIGFMLAGFCAAFLLVRPATDNHAPRAHWLPPALRFLIRTVRADLGNFYFVQHRGIDGFVVTGKNSGSHWLKYMLSAGIAAKYGLPLPAFSTGQTADDIVGHPARARRHKGIPLIGTSHTIPSALHRFIPRSLARRPPIVVMVRAIEDALQSNYRKWRDQYGAPPADFAQGDPSGKRFVADVWWYIYFFNRWGRWAEADPARILVVRYEDLQADPSVWLPRIASHLGLGFDARATEAALQYTSKDVIRERQDPNAGEVIVPDPVRVPPFAFAPAEMRTIRDTLARHLRYRFGYCLAREASCLPGESGAQQHR
jgi:hypothetical protein